jgi:triacylglycerol lipase
MQSAVKWGPGQLVVIAGLAVGVSFALGAGCGGNGQVSSSSGAAGGDAFITGVGGGHTTTTPAGGLGGGGAGGSETTTTDDPAAGAPYPIVLCHGFFGFDKFAGIPGLPYFYHVPERLAQDGETMVYTPAVDPFNSSDFRSDQLIGYIDQILAETKKKKVILIGHSQGGLDARAVAVKAPDKVAAIMTIATPHNGSAVADIALGLTQDPNASAIIDALVKLLGGPLYDQVGNETSVSKALYLFTQPGIAAFNQANPDQPGIFYGSITGRSSLSLGGQDCAADITLPWVFALNGDKDPIDPLFAAAGVILSGGIGGKIPNDGLVRAKDAKRGEFWGCVPADHMDEVGQLVGDDPGLGNGFDHEEMFSSIVKELRDRGY